MSSAGCMWRERFVAERVERSVQSLKSWSRSWSSCKSCIYLVLTAQQCIEGETSGSERG